jgi:hypothetical protein
MTKQVAITHVVVLALCDVMETTPLSEHVHSNEATTEVKLFGKDGFSRGGRVNSSTDLRFLKRLGDRSGLAPRGQKAKIA